MTRVSFIFFHLLPYYSRRITIAYAYGGGARHRPMALKSYSLTPLQCTRRTCERLKITSLAGRGYHTPVISQAVYRASQPLGGLDLFLHTHRDGSASVQHRSMIPSPKGFSYLRLPRFDGHGNSNEKFPFGFQSVKVIALAATDVARAQRFYSETLQLEEDRESTEEVGYRIGESVLISANILRPTIQICGHLASTKRSRDRKMQANQRYQWSTTI
jgi:hypothetical protein